VARYGILNIHKPAGMTSRAVVDRIQRLVRPAKVGHAGTLDPLATGVLVVCVGPATRLISYVQQMPKRYVGTFQLGRQSPTDDTDGEVTELDNPPVPTPDQIAAAAQTLVGEIRQRPPVYSAVKVQGRRAYVLARKGQSVELKPRTVTIHRIEILDYEYPQLTLEVDCGSGTYIRSLGRDLAASLGTAAVMSRLQRTAIGGFRIEDAIELESIAPENWAKHLLPSLRAVELLPQVELSAAEVAQIRQGLAVSDRAEPIDVDQFAAVDAAGQLVAILTHRGRNRLGPSCNLPPA
jgi:tRNA pseudouridine55 synthase